MAAALQEELLAVPGIAGAEVESDSGVAGVRVQLAVGADPDAVGSAVRRILTQHGMRPVGADGAEQEAERPPPPPGAPGSVVSFPLVGEHARREPAPEADSMAAYLESVTVEEAPDGIVVSVRSTASRIAVRTLQSSGAGMDEAVVAAVAELTDHPQIVLADVEEHLLSGQAVITVLLDLGEDRYSSGAAIQLGGRAFAVARAAWIAVMSQV